MNRSVLATFAAVACMLLLAPSALASATMSQRYTLPARVAVSGDISTESGSLAPLIFYAPFSTSTITITVVDDTYPDAAFDACIKTGTATTSCGIGFHDDTTVEHAINTVTVILDTPLAAGGEVQVQPLLTSVSTTGTVAATVSGTAHVTFH